MTGRRNLTVEFGMIAPAGFGWVHSTRMASQVVHLQPSGAGDFTAVCGAGIAGPHGPEFVSGTLCRKCADAAGVRSVGDLAVDDDTADWMEAQREPASPHVAVQHVVLDETVFDTPERDSEPEAQPEPAERLHQSSMHDVLGRAEIDVDAIAPDTEPSRYDVEAAARLLSVLGRQSIIGRDRVLLDKVTEQLLAGVRTKHEHTDARRTKRGCEFDLRLDGTSHVVRVSVDLLRVEP